MKPLCASAVALVALMSVASCSKPTPPSPTKPTVEQILGPPPPVVAGRYTIIHSPQVENDTMLLDTATGRTWRLENASAGEVVWVPVTRQAQ
jgi:hypothetical protein